LAAAKAIIRVILEIGSFYFIFILSSCGNLDESEEKTIRHQRETKAKLSTPIA